jgi:hypothetical protein
MRTLILIYFYLFKLTSASPSSELIYTDQACSLEERVSVTNTANSASECETACYNRYLSNGDCFFYSYFSSEVLCHMFETCNTVYVAGSANTYEMAVSTSAPTTNCVCLNDGKCVNNACFCVYPYYGPNCENQIDCSSCP